MELMKLLTNLDQVFYLNYLEVLGSFPPYQQCKVLLRHCNKWIGSEVPIGIAHS